MRAFTNILLSLILISIIANLAYNMKQNKDEPYYRVYINDEHLTYIDGNTGRIIYTDPVKISRNKTLLNQSIINDNK